MKLSVISITEAVTENEKHFHEKYMGMWEDNVRKVTNESTELDFREPELAVRKAIPDTVEPYPILLNNTFVIDEVRRAVDEGADAVVIGCSEDPGVLEARKITDVPVMGMGQAAMHHAAQLGHKFGILTCNHDAFVAWWETQARRYGLESELTEVMPLDISLTDTYVHGWEDPQPVADHMAEKSREMVDRGAESVVLGSLGMGIMASACDLAQVEASQAPILDMTPHGVKKAEAMVQLQEGLGLPHISRAGFYQRMDEEDVDRVRSIFPQ